MDLRRRSMLLMLAGAPALALAARRPRAPWREAALAAAVGEIEERSGGRLGVALLDTGSGARFHHRGRERFPMCSTFKLLLVAAVLRRVEHDEEALARRVPVREADRVEWAPFCATRMGGDASVEELCAAAMTQSDNIAANLLLATIGGPPAIGTFARTLGDRDTRLDRRETELNSAEPGDPRDTSTPLAMLGNLQALVLGKALSESSRARLERWLRDNRTGDARLRAGLPVNWQAGDKTGSGAHGTTNDIAILWPPGRAPLIVAAYLTGSPMDSPGRDGVHAALAKALSTS